MTVQSAAQAQMNADKTSRSMGARVRARRSAVQALYQWFLTERPMPEIINEFEHDRKELKKADGDYFRDILTGSAGNSDEINDSLTPFLDRALHELDPVTRAVLHLGMYELMHQPGLPLRVVLNEAVELARMFGAEDSYKYINGVLDRAAKEMGDGVRSHNAHTKK